MHTEPNQRPCTGCEVALNNPIENPCAFVSAGREFGGRLAPTELFVIKPHVCEAKKKYITTLG